MATKDVQERPEQVRGRIRPMSSICEEEGTITLRLEMPGVAKEGVDLNLENNQLTIRGTKRANDEPVRYLLRERRDGDYVQSYTVDDTVDPDRIDAKMELGVLTVTLPLRESSKPRKIQITSGS